ncbi:MAG: sugar MFS transporter [Bacteroidetes bacterium]|nr:sugar MFS transporter [Bacteroidota bacterium]
MSAGKILTPEDLTPRQTTISVGIIAVMFFIFGFVSWVNAILIPYFKIACELKGNVESYLVTFAFYISYLVMSVPAAELLKKTGFKKGIMTGFLIMSAGALLFIPAALGRTYGIFLVGLFTLGTGLSILQTAANPYITILGPKESAARRLSLMGIANKTAGILAPLIFAAVVLRATDTDLFRSLETMDETAKASALDELIRRVIYPYAVVGGVLMMLGLAIRFSPLPEIQTAEEQNERHQADHKKSILEFPHVVLGAFAIFFHVGTQVISIDTVISYAEGMGLTLPEAKAFPSFTLTATITGYLLGIALIPSVISQRTALRICTLLGLLFTIGALTLHQKVQWLGYPVHVSIWFIVLLGLANSLVWAGIWPLAMDGLGRFTKKGSSLLIMGLCGNALMPLGYGWLADKTNLTTGYWILVPCYLYLIWYSFKGHLIKSWKF